MKKVSISEIFGFFGSILGPEKNFYTLAIIYGIGISLLSLGLPISVQMVVNTVANTGLTTPLLVLSLSLFALLLIASLLNALRIHLVDIFSRRFYARMVSEISLRSIYALNPFFHDYNKGSLFNRYFDILIVQKTVPNLLVGGFTIVLQAAVGFVLVSLYHPLFLGFSIVIILLIWLIWIVWGSRAIRSAVELSHKKHATATWLEGLGASNGFFKSERHIAEALDKADAVTGEYIEKYEKHFSHYFAQTVCFLLLYATASAALLGLGGWLVLQGQLSLGQLVAAELVMSAIFFGLSQMGTYLAYFYELCAALEELSLFYDVEQEEPRNDGEPVNFKSALAFVDVHGDVRGRMSTLDFSLPANSRVLCAVETHDAQQDFADLLKRHLKPESGYITLGGQDIMGVRAHEVRQAIIVLDQPNAMDMTIREYLRLSGEPGCSSRIITVLETVGLDSTVAALEDGLDTRIAATGWPLTITEMMQLKLAAAIMADPVLLVLNQLFDTMDDDVLERSLDALQEDGDTTVIYLSKRPRRLAFDKYLFLGHDHQELFDDFDALCRRVDGVPEGRLANTVEKP